MDRSWRLLSPLLGVVLTLTVSTSVRAAAPHVLIIYGAPLAQPVRLADWHANGVVLGDEEPTIRPADLRGRPYLNVALFWGSEWAAYGSDATALAALRPEQASQQGRFYPPTRSGPGYLVLESIPGPGIVVRRLTADGLAILARAGVPTDVAALHALLPSTGARPDWSGVAGVNVRDVGALAVALLTLGGVCRRLRTSPAAERRRRRARWQDVPNERGGV